jgi:hypothetical protein
VSDQHSATLRHHSPHCQQGGRGFEPTPADQPLRRFAYYWYLLDNLEKTSAARHRLYTSPEAGKSWQKHLAAERSLATLLPEYMNQRSLFQSEINRAASEFCKMKGLTQFKIPVAAVLFRGQVEACIEHGQPMPAWFPQIAGDVKEKIDAIMPSPGQRPEVRGIVHV